MTTRPGWDDYFMSLARLAAGRSTCDRAQVGAVLVQNHEVVSTGYNGAMRGRPHCSEVDHMIVNGSCIRAVHAEENAIASAARRGVAADGSTAYVTHFPCWRCYRSLAQAGIRKVIFDQFKVNEMNEQIYQEIINNDTIYLWSSNGKPFQELFRFQDGVLINS